MDPMPVQRTTAGPGPLPVAAEDPYPWPAGRRPPCTCGSAADQTDEHGGRGGAQDGQEGQEGQEEQPEVEDQQDAGNLDEVDEASRESFPASDPPAFTPLHIGS